MDFRSAYSPRERVHSPHGVKSRTREAMKQECDINFILRNYRKSGLVSHVNQYQGDYGEFLAMDFHEAMNTVAAANAMFETVPAKIRAEFANDPGLFLSFVTNPDNIDRMREMGLAPAAPKSSDPVVKEPPVAAAEPAPE